LLIAKKINLKFLSKCHQKRKRKKINHNDQNTPKAVDFKNTPLKSGLKSR